MNESDYLQRLADILRLLFIAEDVTIETEYPVVFENQLRRYIDLFVFSKQHGLYIFELNRYQSELQIVDAYLRVKQITKQLIKSRFENYRRKTRVFLVITNVFRLESDSESITLGRSDIQLPGDVTLIYTNDLERDIRPIIVDAPIIDFDEARFETSNIPPKEHDVFISYRRMDTAWAAGRLADYLKTIYSSPCIFFDTRNIDWGDDFIQVIKKQVDSSSILLAIIGKKWLKIAHPDTGIRRLDDPNDLVRIEISTGLNNNSLVIPILIDDAKMPPASSLPSDLQQLSFKNAGTITANNFHVDVIPLINRLDKSGMKRKGRTKKNP